MKRKEMGKRILDIIFAIGAMPIALPVVTIFAAAIRMETEGSPFFMQVRIGRGKRPFMVYKLRTMIKGAEKFGAGLYAEKNDPRFTRVGTLARRFSADELPQLINVLRGEMSIVGPRPMPAVIVSEHEKEYQKILEVKPGLTGLVQIRGRNELPRSKRVEYDLEYADNWSVLGDISIILKTVRVVLTGVGQRNDQGMEDVEK
jgi:lipopolysaccharide/colanic/teichoic acid biosynthesis glycosyltransferase